MRLRLLSLVIVLLGLHAASAQAQEAPACAPETPHALAFEGLRAQIPYGPLETFYVADNPRSEESVVGRVQIEMVGADGETFFSDRAWDVEVRIDGPLATAWMPYGFWLRGAFSHCGIDAFQLVRTGDEWRILQLTYTARTERCEIPEGVRP